jgi:DNA-binding IclR family transcriptional regulator
MSSQPNQGILDGLVCLEALAAAGEPVGCRELARRLDLHHVRANRLLKSLVDAGFARQDRNRRYLPGPAFHVLAALATHGSGLLRRALPHLQRLARASGAVVALGVMWRGQVCYLYHGDARTPAAEALGRTRLVPASESSIGTVLAEPSRGHVCLEHRSDQRATAHHSIAVPVGAPPIAGLACTGVPLDAPVAPIVSLLTATAAAIAAEEPT